jgi:hypothetical protein
MTIEQIKNLLSIATPADITSFVINDIYEDDHAQCADVVINGVPLEFLWFDNVGFIDYWNESPKAFDKLLSAITAAVTMVLESIDESEYTAEHEALLQLANRR